MKAQRSDASPAVLYRDLAEVRPIDFCASLVSGSSIGAAKKRLARGRGRSRLDTAQPPCP
jgi:hypothetical protein